MSDTFNNYVCVTGPHDDLLKITKELNYAEKYHAEYDWEHDGASATIHFVSECDMPIQMTEAIVAKYPSVNILWRYTQELLYAGTMKYENGRLKTMIIFDWITGHTDTTKY